MLKLPRWVQEVFDQSACPFRDCRKKLENQGVIAVGAREEKHPETKQELLSFFYEYKCPHCRNRSVFTGFPTTLEDFIGDMIEISNSTDFAEQKVMYPDRRSKISTSEVKDALKFMRQSNDFKDFMHFFGIDEVEPDDGNDK